MPFKCFYDGGSKDDSSFYDTVTLAVMSGFNYQWDAFAKDWRRMLTRHKADHVHITDLMTGNGIYKGWSLNRCDALAESAVRVIRKHVAHRKDNPTGRREGIIPVVIGIAVKDFLAADKVALKMSTSANELLLRQALGICMNIGLSKKAKFFDMFFDQGEPFYGLVHNLKNSKQARKDAYALDQIIGLSEVDSRRYPEMQMADMFAWAEAQKNLPMRRLWHSRLLHTDHGTEYYDKTNLSETLPGTKELWDSWKIPPIKATK